MSIRKDVKQIDNYCRICGSKMQRKRFPNGRLETYGCFKKRKYCNRECMSKAFSKKERIGQSWMAEHDEARKLVTKRECGICKTHKNLDVHHIDGDYHNNDISNLMVVCRSCHMKIHRPKSICKVEECTNVVKGYGFCEKHYQRYKKTGNPLLTKHDIKKGVV